MSSTDFLGFIKQRRTFYALKKETTIPDGRIQEIVKEAVLHIPSAFNSQSTRVILLVKEEHDKLWEIVRDVLKAIVPPEAFHATSQRVDGFKAGYGTVLFFESRGSITTMQQKFSLYADKFPVWASQSGAMHQFAIWTALEAEGLGASLQHYNPIINERVAKEWNVDPDWELDAQLVFGSPVAQPQEKTFAPLEDRFKSFGI